MPSGYSLFLDTYLSLHYKYPCNARVAELVDARDLKSLGIISCTGSIPVPSTIKKRAKSAT